MSCRAWKFFFRSTFSWYLTSLSFLEMARPSLWEGELRKLAIERWLDLESRCIEFECKLCRLRVMAIRLLAPIPV